LNYNSAEGVFLTLTLAYFARLAMGHLWYNSETNFTGSISASTLKDCHLLGQLGLLNHLPLDSRLQLPFETHFILADSRPELSYSGSWSETLESGQLRERHAFNMTKKGSKNQSLINTDRVTANLQASAQSFFKLRQVPFHDSKYSQPCHMYSPIARR
jgi:hypothetical protein